MIGKVNNVKLNFAGNTQKPKKENVVSKPQNQNAKHLSCSLHNGLREVDPIPFHAAMQLLVLALHHRPK